MKLRICLIVVIWVTLLAGCSQSDQPLTPRESENVVTTSILETKMLQFLNYRNNNNDFSELTNLIQSPYDTSGINAPGRISSGLYYAKDAGDGKMDIIQFREATKHFNIVSFLLPPACYDCFSSLYKWNTWGWWDYIVTARNPTFLTGYDVRVQIFPEHYPHPGDQFAVGDDWSPFMPTWEAAFHPYAAFKTPANRAFTPNLAWWTEFAIFSDSPDYIFAVDASWPGNCREPFEIINFYQSNPLMGDGTGFCTLTVDVNDWQWDVGPVYADLSIMGGSPVAQMTWVGGSKWQLNLGAFWLWPDVYPISITAYTFAPVYINCIRDLAFVTVW